MSDRLIVKTINNRNLQDLRVILKQTQGSVIGVDCTQLEALDFPIFSFDENIFPGSPCPTENLMDSVHLYNSIEQDKKTHVTTSVESPAKFDLDPILENSVDIQELLINSVQDEALESIILGDTQNGVSSVPNINLHTQASLKVDVPSLKELDFMSNQEQSQTTLEANWPTTIKSEDLHALSPSPSEEAVSSSTLTPPSTPPVISVDGIVRGRPGRKPSAGGPIRNRKRQPEKGTEEYIDKRTRNNVAVRKSRDKAKKKQKETEERVQELCAENENLQKKLDLLTKELNVLKSLFINVGASLPTNFDSVMSS